MTEWPDDDVILFDGVCVFCSRWIRFVAVRDIDRRFRFTPIQSAYGTRLARAFGIDPDDPDTNAVIHGGRVHLQSDAALTVLSSRRHPTMVAAAAIRRTNPRRIMKRRSLRRAAGGICSHRDRAHMSPADELHRRKDRAGSTQPTSR